eukprot:COSAG02_NODE_5105_length_4624_cov_6.735691_7_plen_80_part_00
MPGHEQLGQLSESITESGGLLNQQCPLGHADCVEVWGQARVRKLKHTICTCHLYPGWFCDIDDIHLRPHQRRSSYPANL